jgi:hypothetical protein
MNELDSLKREIRYLRHYGNTDCTAMADEAMEKDELEEATVPQPLPARDISRLYDLGSPVLLQGCPPVRQCCHAGCTKQAVDMHGVGTITHGFCLEHRTCQRCGKWMLECTCVEGPQERRHILVAMGALLDRVFAGKL